MKLQEEKKAEKVVAVIQVKDDGDGDLTGHLLVFPRQRDSPP